MYTDITLMSVTCIILLVRIIPVHIVTDVNLVKMVSYYGTTDVHGHYTNVRRMRYTVSMHYTGIHCNGCKLGKDGIPLRNY